MARNIEIKARIDSVAAMQSRLAALATQGPVEIAQDDAFFHCPNGRLKLRSFSPTDGELIFYQRSDLPGPKESFYLRTPTASPAALRELLEIAYGACGRVQKQRTLYLVGRTRVHLDVVHGLGEFLELEVVLAEGESPQAGLAQAHQLMTQLGLSAVQLLPDAYVDLLNRLVPPLQ